MGGPRRASPPPSTRQPSARASAPKKEKPRLCAPKKKRAFPSARASAPKTEGKQRALRKKDRGRRIDAMFWKGKQSKWEAKFFFVSLSLNFRRPRSSTRKTYSSSRRTPSRRDLSRRRVFRRYFALVFSPRARESEKIQSIPTENLHK